MRKWLVFALLLAWMMSPATVNAQGGVRLEAMNVELWSEYDQPSMLVIDQFVVSPDTPLPAMVTMHLPKEG
ncbi:MAG TPA: hypothetical protein VK249_32545, partial [Anaerolineales bacterium]|nr:hypothetical protein [Anaerolineales bacterium]